MQLQILSTMARAIYLLAYPVPSSKFNFDRHHGAIFIPSLTCPTVGNAIHVTGTPFTGHGLEFKRNYDLATRGRKHRLHLLAEVDEEFVQDIPGDGKFVIGVTPRDVLERKTKSVESPGASPRPLEAGVVLVAASLVTRNCEG